MAKKHKVETEFVLVDSKVQGSGGMTYWTMRGDVNPEALRTAWLANDLPEQMLVETPSPQVALTRALRELEGEDLKIDSMNSDESVLMLKGKDERGLPKWTAIATWRLNKVGRPEQTFAADADCMMLDASVQSFFDIELSRISTTDVANWLKRIAVFALHGVVMRESGGVYFIPPASLPTWERIKSAVETATQHKVYCVPMLRADGAVEAIMSAVIAETEQELTALRAALEAHSDGTKPKGHVGLDSLAHKAAEKKSKLAAYTQFLGVTMPQLDEQLEEMKASLFQASAVAKAQKEASR
jgi:hypothetical protein